MISLQQIVNSSFSLRLVAILAHRLPSRLGRRIAYSVADQIASQHNSELVQAVRANQWVVSGEVLRGEKLDWAVRETFRHWARCIFDLYHCIDNPDATKPLILLEPSFQPIARRPEFERRGKQRGLVIVGLHLSNFDLVLQWLCRQGMKPLVITIPDPQGGRRMEYEIRRRTGLNLLPASVEAFRQAIKHLRQGGMVLTWIDRPIPNPEVQPRFFGRPAALPVYHTFLATKTGSPVIIAATSFQKDGKYHVFASSPVEMEVHRDRDAGELYNAEKVLTVAEEFIRQHPQQWSVPLPVWPQVMDPTSK